jgi:saccharopine dehydrogenase-like NADP-dependent oxidoreductase
VIDGNSYECNYTSGGAADLPEVLAGKVKNLNYKTLRYPGHFNWVLGILKDIPKGIDKIKYLQTEMKKNIPTVEDDVVILHAVVRGFDESDTLFQLEKFFKIKPKKIGKRMLRAIQLTTAAPMAECARMILLGKYQGVILQSMIDTNEFMKGPFIKKAYF